MNNFDENNEFVKRPTSSGSETPPRNIPGNVRRPQNSTQNRVDGEIRRPQNTPQGRVGGEIRRPQNPYVGGSVRHTNTSEIPRPAATGAYQRPPRQMPDHQTNDAPAINQKNKTKIDKGTIIKNILIFVAMLAAMLVIGFSLLLSSLYVAPEKDRTSYTFIMEDNEIESVTVNKVLYINISKLSDMCGFTVSGTKAFLRFTAFHEEFVEFTIGSRSAKINGDIVNMEGAALVREGENVWVPLTFIETYFTGLEIAKNEEDHTISVSRKASETDENDNPIYENITFKVKGSQTLEGIDEDPDIGDIEKPEFANDLSEYEQYMNPEDRDAYLILVNKTNSISSEDIPENLVSIVDVRKDGRKEQMVECAEKALEAMFIELRSAGYTDVSVTSGYRSYNKQVSLFSTYLQREMANNPSLTEAQAKEIVLTYSAFPGTSEHQTGLCCDMHNLPSADVKFAQKEAYTWLKENCHKFGFVIRFPEDKVDITGYSFEPWHYRFVGRYHATRMYNLNMCLEEYVDHLAKAQN